MSPAAVDVEGGAPNGPEHLPIAVSPPTPYTFDLGNLLCSDANPLPPRPTAADIHGAARDCAQALVNQVLSTLPITSTAAGVMVGLPACTTALPREKPIPAARAETRWEAFARKKGIKDRRRGEGKTVYDEARGEWVPKWGYKGRNKDGEGEWIVEVDGKKAAAEEEEGKSVRGAGRRERLERTRRNERRQRANERRGRKGEGGGATRGAGGDEDE